MSSPTSSNLIAPEGIESFLGLINAGLASFEAAAEMLARLCKADPGFRARLHEAAPQLTEHFVAGLIRVGERTLHPALLMTDCPCYDRLHALPLCSQKQIIELGAVEVVTNAMTGDIVRVPLVELRGHQLAQAISPKGLRSRDEQRAYIRRRVRAVACDTSGVVGPGFAIKRDHIVSTREGAVMTKIEMLHALTQMG